MKNALTWHFHNSLRTPLEPGGEAPRDGQHNPPEDRGHGEEVDEHAGERTPPLIRDALMEQPLAAEVGASDRVVV